MVIVSVAPEIAFNNVGSYAGGLGVLEGDKFIEAEKLGLNILVVSFLYRKGYVNYRISKLLWFKQRLVPVYFEKTREVYEKLGEEPPLCVEVKHETACAIPWVYSAGNAKLVLFEVKKPKWLRIAAEKLYIERNDLEKIYKWILFAKLTAKYLRERVGLTNVEVIDLQEAYTALLVFALPEYKNFRLITHTPGPWGHPKISAKILKEEFGVDIDVEEETITRLALERISKAFAVSKKHYDVCVSKLFVEFSNKFSYVTNGISIDRWRHKKVKELLHRKGIDNIDAEEFWEIHLEIKRELIENIVKRYKPKLTIVEDTPIVIWCRRLTKYKRPYFVINFIKEIGKDLNAMFLLGGKAHPVDVEGLRYANEFLKLSRKYDNVVFVHDYDVDKAKYILSGGDIHLFTPFPGWEACGTSYMKAAVNGVPTLSSRDGGALEFIVDGVNGWFFGFDVREFIDIYRDDKAKEIDAYEYKEFKEKLLNIIKMYGSEEYKDVMVRVLKLSESLDVKRVLHKYYNEVLGSRLLK